MSATNPAAATASLLSATNPAAATAELAAAEDLVLGPLSEPESLARCLLVDFRGWHELNRFVLSRRLRNKTSASNSCDAFALLHSNGVVERTLSPQRRGMPKEVITKRSWLAIESDHSDKNPTRFLKKLRVNRDAFE